MDFYEELGVSQKASEIEIRQSYKRLTLLLHPDQQQNPELRALAEGQMKRLNEMAEILTDPERRRAYNESLRERTLIVRQTPPIRWGSWIRNNRGWVLVSLAFVIVLIAALLVPTFDSARDSAGSAAAVHDTVPGAAHPASHRVPEKPRLDPSQTAATESGQRGIERRRPDAEWKPAPGLAPPPRDAYFPAANAANNAANMERPVPVPQATVTPLAHAITPEVPVTAPLPVPPVQTAPSTPRSTPTLAGRWVFTPEPSDAGDSNLFPAEYVELSIFLSGNTLRGAYQSRYKLSERRLNSHVNFTFEGTAAATSFIWQGDSGAQGEIRIRLESADILKVNWFATAMGSALSLGSGSAKLYRFR